MTDFDKTDFAAKFNLQNKKPEWMSRKPFAEAVKEALKPAKTTFVVDFPLGLNKKR